MTGHHLAYREAETETLLYRCQDGPASGNSSNEWLDTNTTLPGGEQAQTFDLTLPAPRAGLLPKFVQEQSVSHLENKMTY